MPSQSNNKKTYIIKYLAVIILLVVIIYANLDKAFTPSFDTDFTVPISSMPGTANYIQNQTYCFLHMYNGKLYMLCGYKLYVVSETGSLQLYYSLPRTGSLFDKKQLFFSFFIQNKLYYCENVFKNGGNLSSSTLRMIDLDTKENIVVSDDFSSNAIIHSDFCICPNPDTYNVGKKKAISYAIIDSSGVQYVAANGINDDYYYEEYVVGTSTISVEYDWDLYARLFVIENGEQRDLISRYGQYRVEQLTDGSLLIMNHIDTLGPHCIAWIYGTDGILHELMYIEGSDIYSCANVCNGYYYCSFKRFKESHVLKSKRYKNDQLEGTWRIDLSTFEKTKISNKVYKGLFVFGNQLFGIGENNRCYYIDS